MGGAGRSNSKGRSAWTREEAVSGHHGQVEGGGPPPAEGAGRTALTFPQREREKRELHQRNSYPASPAKQRLRVRFGAVVRCSAPSSKPQHPSMARLVAALALSTLVASQNTSCFGAASLYDGSHAVNFLNGSKLELASLAGRVLLTTNVASF